MRRGHYAGHKSEWVILENAGLWDMGMKEKGKWRRWVSHICIQRNG